MDDAAEGGSGSGGLAPLGTLVDRADVAGLLRAIDGLCASRQWGALVDLARRCRDAIELGKQLWPVAMHIDYRLAWEGPAPYAAAVLRPGAGRFALGPLTEVAASTHEWAALAPFLDDAVSAATVAQERVLRGEMLHGQVDAPELPLALEPWEPRYPLPVYRDRSAAFPQPVVATETISPPRLLRAGPALPEDEAALALRSTVEVWLSQSSGRADVVAAEGDAAMAVGLLVRQAALSRVTPADALSLLQWAGASGGAYGRRPGGAAGRFAAWWAAAALAGLDWPAPGDLVDFAADLGDALAELRWYRWQPEGAETGWTLRLAVDDPVHGLAWAVDATDSRDDDVVIPSA